MKRTFFLVLDALSAPNPAAGHYWPMPLPETPGQSQENLGQSLVCSLLLSPGSWGTQGFFVPSKSVSLVLWKFQWLLVGLMWPPPRELMPHPGLLHPKPQVYSLRQATADPYFHRTPSNTVLAQSLWDLWVLMCITFVWALQVSLECMQFNSKCSFAPTVLLGLLLCS